ncbi:hypothetical protein [Geodermatophilus sp. SYSU D00766]
MTRTRLTRTLLRAAVPTAAFAAVVATTGTASADSYAYNAYDTDANGYIDLYAFDDSGDGYEDTWAVDWDENGLTEQVAVDTDGDGWADTFAFDSDEDGYVEEVGVDTTYNGLPDVWGADTDYDGYVDAVAYDYDDDGYADHSELATSASYAYTSVSYVFAEADGWAYWEVSVEYGYGLVSEQTADSGIDAKTGALTITGNTADDDAVDAAADALRTLF